MRKSLSFMLIFFTALTLILSCGTVYAWYATQRAINLVDLQGNILTSYFHCGTGSEEDPYVITRPVHLYNLTELYQELDGFDTSNYYFQIGYDLDNDGDLEVYNYNDINKYTNEYSDVLNMKYYEDKFVPIGTVDYPFNGTFKGNNFIVNNLTIMGSDESDVGLFGYVGASANISDLYLDNFTIDITNLNASNILIDENHTKHEEDVCYVGYIAGHCETFLAFSNIYLNRASIIGMSETDLRNKYGFFGYAADAAELDKMIQKAKGDETGFGGSVDMEEMYNRIETIQREAATTYIPTTSYYGELDEQQENTARVQYYYDWTKGSFTWYQYGDNDFTGNYNYLGGGVQSVDKYYNIEEKTGYRIHNGNNYVTNNSATSTTLSYTSYTGNAINNAAIWTLSETPTNNAAITISISINNKTYYLNNTSLSTSSYTWTFISSGNGFKLKNGNNYLRYNRGFTTTTNQNNATIFTFDQGDFYRILNQSEVTYNVDYLGYFNTYFPLIVDETGSVVERNTGYVISGSNFINDSYEFTIKSGDIRVSKYATSNINNSYSTRNGLTNVYTINANGSRQTVNSSNYVRYETAKQDFLESISSGNIYGLHFMNGLIDINKVVQMPYALINGEEYVNYKMPADSIDFNLADKGYITFFAGTYFTGNDSFFSLHSIERDENQNITNIKEIIEILSDGNERHDYIYKYDDGSYSGDPIGYSVIFKTSQIKKNSLTSNAVYYFEIPVNEGEYALGSVDGGTGAYLMYLDIGTNGGGIESVKNFETVDYKNKPDTAEISPFLFDYTELDNEHVHINIEFQDETYYITATADKEIEITFGLLKSNTKVIFNDIEYNKIDLYKIRIN